MSTAENAPATTLDEVQNNQYITVVIVLLLTIVLLGVLIWLSIIKEVPVPIVNVNDLPSSKDAFGRLRVSDTFTLSDSKNIHTTDAEYNDKLVNGGSITHLPNEASYRLQITGQGGSRCVRQTRMYHNYQPGKSQITLMSFLFGPLQEGIVRRAGYFDDDNGVFLEQNGTTGLYSIVRREKTGGVVTEHRIPQSSWDNQSIVLDFTKVQLLKIDFQWLGVGKIRFFLSNAMEELLHTILIAGINNTVSFTDPNLPDRYEILNDSYSGTSLETFTMKMICSTTMSEGGYSEVGLDGSIASGHIHRNIANGGDELPILAIRLKSTFEGRPNRYYVRPGDYSIYVETAPVLFIIYRLEQQTQIVGGSWISAAPDSVVEYNATATGYSLVGGYQQLNGGLIGATTAQKSSGSLNTGPPSTARKEIITQNFDSNDSQVIVIVCKALGNSNNVNAKVWATLQWREIY
jgi:hypothetical protein